MNIIVPIATLAMQTRFAFVTASPAGTYSLADLSNSGISRHPINFPRDLAAQFFSISFHGNTTLSL
jgi:hypothetical protein